MKHKLLRATICAASAVVLSLGSVRANVIYDNFANQSGYAFSMANGEEIGNQITIPTGVSWSLTNFSVEYYSPSATLASDVAIDVRFYQNDGTPENGFPTPGTLIFDSGWFNNNGSSLPGNGYQVVTYTSSDFYGSSSAVNMDPGFLFPDSLSPDNSFTFTVSFQGLDSRDQIDMPVAANTPGISYGDYWLNNGSGWSLMSTNAADANLTVDFSGQQVPEPASLTFVAIGGALLLGIKQLRRKG